MAFGWLQKICAIDINGRLNSVSEDTEAGARSTRLLLYLERRAQATGAVGAVVVRSARAYRSGIPGQGQPSGQKRIEVRDEWGAPPTPCLVEGKEMSHTAALVTGWSRAVLPNQC